MALIETIGDPQGPLGAHQSLKTVKTCVKFSYDPSFTLHISNNQFSQSEIIHSKICYLDFSWHTKLSIENPWGPEGALGGPSETENCQNMSQFIIYSCVHLPYV